MSAAGPGSDADEVDTGDTNSGSLWGAIAPNTVQEFAAAPVAFIVGALADVFIGGLEEMVAVFIGAILAVFEALAAVPASAESILLGTGGAAGSTLLGALNGFFAAMQAAVAAAGPGAPLLAAVLVAGAIVAGAYVARFVWTLAVDALNPL